MRRVNNVTSLVMTDAHPIQSTNRRRLISVRAGGAVK